MGKPLTQITFEFSTEEDKELKPVSNQLNEIVMEENPVELKEQDISADAIAPNKSPVDLPVGQTGKRGRLSLKEIGLNADLVQVPPDEILFQKQYYSIGEVAGWFRVNQSLIRYWETEFDILQPRKNRKGDRFFRPVDVKNLLLIYDLLRRRKFTIEGAKDFLKKSNKADEKFTVIQSLEKIKSFLNELKASL